MRIITGTLKGRRIQIPKGLNVRPTSDRTKEGMFSVITSHKYLADARVLDLFAGSGNLGFEAISRGARSVLFVESDRQNVKQIEKQAESFKVSDQVRTQVMPVDEYLQWPATAYDFVFADPPYDYPMMPELIEKVLEKGWITETGWFLLEHDKRHDFSDHPNCFFTRAYGRTIVSIFTQNPE